MIIRHRDKSFTVEKGISDFYDADEISLILVGKCYTENYCLMSTKEVMEMLFYDGIENLRRVHGVFWGYLFNKREEKAFLFQDRMGLSTVYYYLKDGNIYISDKISEITNRVDAKFKLDFSAWSEFLTFRHIIGNKSFFEGIKTIEQGKVISIVNNKINSQTYDDWNNFKIVNDLNIDEVAEKISCILQKTIKNMIENNIKKDFKITLSGGWDSRIILGLVNNITKEFETITSYYDNGDNKEEVYARLVSEKLGAKNYFVDIDEDYYNKDFSTYVDKVNYVNSLGLWFFNFINKVEWDNVLCFDGYAGDLLLRGYKQVSASELKNKSIDEIFDDMAYHRTLDVSTRTTYTTQVKIAKNSLSEELCKYSYNSMKYHLANRNKNAVATSLYLQQEMMDVMTPFTNNELIDYIFTLPDDIRLDEKLYPKVFELIDVRLLQVVSTNDKCDNDYYSDKKIYKHSTEVLEMYKNLLFDDFRNGLGFYDPIKVLDKIEKFKNYSEIPSKEFYLVEDIYYYKAFLKQYENLLCKTSFMDYFLDDYTGNKEKKYENIMVTTGSSYKNSVKKWGDFLKRYVDHNNNIDLYMTVDVEGFRKDDIYSKHTSYEDYVNCLVTGAYNGTETLEMLAKKMNVPFTFFVEAFSDIYEDEGVFTDIVEVCSKNMNEVGLHCHYPSIKDSGIYDGLWNADTLTEVIKEGSKKISDITGEKPKSYRSGSFEVHNGHFEALSKNGFLVDSSLYYKNSKDFTGIYNDGYNSTQLIGDILEVPVTTYYDMYDKQRVRRLDFNQTHFDKKLEVIAKHLYHNMNHVNMYMHSWSFSDMEVINGVHKSFHYKHSVEAVEELKWLVEFVMNNKMIRLKTLSEDIIKPQIMGMKEGVIREILLIDVNGSISDTQIHGNSPDFREQRSKRNENFIDLTIGDYSDNDTTAINCMNKYKVALTLKNLKQPKKGDFIRYDVDLDFDYDRVYKFSFLLDTPYFKEKFRNRNTISCTVYLGEELLTNYFITEKIEVNLFEYIIIPKSNNMKFSIILECLIDEKPWGWGSASKTMLEYLNIEVVGREMEKTVLINELERLKNEIKTLDEVIVGKDIISVEIENEKIFLQESNFVLEMDNKQLKQKYQVAISGHEEKLKLERNNFSKKISEIEVNKEESIEKLSLQINGLVDNIENIKNANKSIYNTNAKYKAINKQLHADVLDYTNKIKLLSNDKNKLEESMKKQFNEIKELADKYEALANSRLGRVTLQAWKIRNKVRGNAVNDGNIVKNDANRKSLISPFRFRFADYPFKQELTKGNLSEALEIVKNGLTRFPEQDILQNHKQLIIDKIDILNSMDYLNERITITEKKSSQTTNQKVLHVLNTSMPYLSNGYSIRSNCIIENQINNGINLAAVTRPGYPNDFGKNCLDINQDVICESFNDVNYYRLTPSVFLRETPTKEYIDGFAKGITDVIDKELITIIHASSNYTIGLSALKAAQSLNLPFVYEIRGFWEMTTLSKCPEYENSEEYLMSHKVETYIAEQAEKVVVISNGLKRELLDRGIDDSKITVIPNGVDLSKFYVKEPNHRLIDKYDIEDAFVIGYIGSIVKYEGIQTVIKALQKLVDDGYKNFKYIIVGDGNYLEVLKEMTEDLNLLDYVIFTGRIPHDQVIDYYSVFDLCVYYREYEKVTELVTPLKPLEAMACGKIVIGSDLNAIKEMVIDDVNGYIVSGNEFSLAVKIEDIYLNNKMYKMKGLEARDWVVNNRSWEELAKSYQDVYDFDQE